jgi:hypothetical protein
MEEEVRLGDIVDDHCSKCRMVTNHAVVAVVNAEIARTRCRTCYFEHPYRRAKGGGKKKVSTKAALFDEILSKIPRPPSPAPKKPKP